MALERCSKKYGPCARFCQNYVRDVSPHWNYLASNLRQHCISKKLDSRDRSPIVRLPLEVESWSLDVERSSFPSLLGRGYALSSSTSL